MACGPSHVRMVAQGAGLGKYRQMGHRRHGAPSIEGKESNETITSTKPSPGDLMTAVGSNNNPLSIDKGRVHPLHVFPALSLEGPEEIPVEAGALASSSRGYSCGTAPDLHRSSPLASLASGRRTPQPYYSVTESLPRFAKTVNFLAPARGAGASR
jgi:hypothetical protein